MQRAEAADSARRRGRAMAAALPLWMLVALAACAGCAADTELPPLPPTEGVGPPGAAPPSRSTNVLTGGAFVNAGGPGDPAYCDNGREQLTTCLQKLPPLLRNTTGVGIPSSKEDIDAACSAFKTGMGCVEDYARSCLSEHSRRLLEQQVAGANYTFHFLCHDKKFQAEYLQYTSCYKGISREWESCANRFMQLLREETGRRNVSEQTHMLEVCCAKFGFLRCVYVASRHICRKEEALFLNRIAETLSAIRIYSPVCRDLNMAAVCAAPPAPAGFAPSPACTLALAAAAALLPWALLGRGAPEATRRRRQLAQAPDVTPHNATC